MRPESHTRRGITWVEVLMTCGTSREQGLRGVEEALRIDDSIAIELCYLHRLRRELARWDGTLGRRRRLHAEVAAFGNAAIRIDGSHVVLSGTSRLRVVLRRCRPEEVRALGVREAEVIAKFDFAAVCADRRAEMAAAVVSRLAGACWRVRHEGECEPHPWRGAPLSNRDELSWRRARVVTRGGG